MDACESAHPRHTAATLAEQCPPGKGGTPPLTIAEFTLNPRVGTYPDFYDVSMVDGFNAGVAIFPVEGTFEQADGYYTCGSPGCSSCDASFMLQACDWDHLTSPGADPGLNFVAAPPGVTPPPCSSDDVAWGRGDAGGKLLAT